MTAAMGPVVYWLVFFSIIFHGLSIPALNAFYTWRGVEPILEEDPVEILVLSENDPLPSNAYIDPRRGSVVAHNRFSRPTSVYSASVMSPGRSMSRVSFAPSERTRRRSRSRDLSQADIERGWRRSRSMSYEVGSPEVEREQWAGTDASMTTLKTFPAERHHTDDNLDYLKRYEERKNMDIQLPERTLKWKDEESGEPSTPQR